MAAPVCVARIGAALGVRGAVKLWTFTEDPRAVERYGPLMTKDGARQFEIANLRAAKDHLVATFKGIASRNDAESLNGIELYVPRDKLPATDEDEYYHTDLIGLAHLVVAIRPKAPVPGGGLADAGRDHVAHDDLAEGLGLDVGGLQRGRQGLGAKLGRGISRQGAAEGADRRARRGEDQDFLHG